MKVVARKRLYFTARPPDGPDLDPAKSRARILKARIGTARWKAEAQERAKAMILKMGAKRGLIE